MNEHAMFTKLIEINSCVEQPTLSVTLHRHECVAIRCVAVEVFYQLVGRPIDLLSNFGFLSVKCSKISFDSCLKEHRPISYLTNHFWQHWSYRMSHSIGFIKSDTFCTFIVLLCVRVYVQWAWNAVVRQQNVSCPQKLSSTSFFRHSIFEHLHFLGLVHSIWCPNDFIGFSSSSATFHQPFNQLWFFFLSHRKCCCAYTSAFPFEYHSGLRCLVEENRNK